MQIFLIYLLQAVLYCVIIFGMKVELDKYRGKKICVAVSGGRDSMALLHYMRVNAEAFGITLCAVNCDHMLRGKASESDSRFVKDICEKWKIQLDFYKTDCAALAKKTGVGVEACAREWRRECYFNAKIRLGADAVATAHHMNDNAETVLFNIARGSGLAGVTGITDGKITIPVEEDDKVVFDVIRPLIECTRAEIDCYIVDNKVPYVEDATNGGDDYTRNYIRHNVIPQLEKAVPSAVSAIYRFSRLAAEDEQFFDGLITEKNLIAPTICGVEIRFCKEKPLFTRAAIKAIKLLKEDIKDYTFGHAERLYALQLAENGKKFEFLKLVAFAEDDKIVICRADMLDLRHSAPVPFNGFGNNYFGQYAEFCSAGELEERLNLLCEKGCHNILKTDKIKALKFDGEKIPHNAVIRFMRTGDKFTKFGGGTKNLSDYFTDKKIPVRLRGVIPLVAAGSEILIVCGVEISDKVRLTDETKAVRCVICADYLHL